ncbi:hypothetical protein KC19_12G101900 [Ceratodon purpureus]|uniref:Uncharacterized protein n=1 Tax=Ceratodon purpureus TaxID=3225 RepID=A0A8T0G7Y8_CERPU|nr:hypothetical protein KC19_12G101900 [Ceratodon purpureus]
MPKKGPRGEKTKQRKGPRREGPDPDVKCGDPPKPAIPPAPDKEKPVDVKTNYPETFKPANGNNQDVDGASNMADEGEGQGEASGCNHRGRTCEDVATLTPASASAHALNLNSGVDRVEVSKDRRPSDQDLSAKEFILDFEFGSYRPKPRPESKPESVPEEIEDASDINVLLGSYRPELPWAEALKTENCADLLGLVKEISSLGHFAEVEFRKGAGSGRQTALHIAAKRDDAELAILILDKLLEYREGRYAIADKRNGYFTVDDYIRAIEKESKKTAFELAKEQENSKVICEKIIDTLNRSEAYVKIDVKAITLQKELRDEEFIINEIPKRRRDVANGPKRIRVWLSKIISIRDCNFSIKFLKKFQDIFGESSAHGEYNESSAWFGDKDLWKFKDDSGRTLLHVAAMQGCFLLAKQLLDIARKRNDRDYIEAIDPESGLTAFKMANDVIGNRSIAQYIINTLELLKDESYVHSSFSEVYPRTLWCRILEGGCDFQDVFPHLSYQLLLQTYNGNTILHVAIILNNRMLLLDILQIFGEKRKISFGEESSFSKVLLLLFNLFQS